VFISCDKLDWADFLLDGLNIVGANYNFLNGVAIY
jgi:hypothetical protein